jgi:tripartite-type tricarboxylate transporter receptor subunit TctC
MKSNVIIAVIIGVLAFGSVERVLADEYPSHPIRIIAPIAAGGPSDTAARLVAKFLTLKLHQSVIVENHTGAGGIVGTELAARAVPDGYTLLLSIAATFTIIPVTQHVAYDVDHDFIPLGQIWQAPQALVVSASSKFKSVSDLLTYAKSNPEKLTFGSAGIGTTTHLSIELLQQETGVKVIHVPYRGTSQSVADIMSGNIDAAFGDVANVAPFVTGGKLRALAVTSDKRSILLPSVPTTGEAGIPGVNTVNWYGLHVQSETPPDVVAKLRQALADVQQDSEFKAALARYGTSTGTIGADAFGAMIAADRKKMTPILKRLAIQH